MNLNSITGITSFFTDKGASQISTLQNAANARTDPSTTLTKKFNYSFGRDAEGKLLEEAEQEGDLIGIGYFKKGADIMYQGIEVLVDAEAVGFECEIGTLSDTGEFVVKATLSSQGGFVGVITIPEPHNELLEEPTWLAARVTGIAPTSGRASFYVPYIALA